MKRILLSAFIFKAALFLAQTPNLTWVKSAGSATSDVGNAIAVDQSGNVYTTGYFNSTVDFDPGAGTSNLTSAGLSDIFVSKLNSSGNFVWAAKFGGSTADLGYGISTDGSGNVYISGSFSGTSDFDPGAGTFTLASFGGTDIFIVKLDASGNLVWAKQLGGSGNDESRSIIVDGPGNVHTTGYFSGTSDFNPGPASNTLISAGQFDIFISKLDAAGNYVWAKNFGGPTNDIGNSIAIDGTGNVYSTGHFSGAADFDPAAPTFSLNSMGAGDIFVSKLDVLGNFSFAKRMGGTGNDVGNGLAVDASGNIYSGGYFFGTADFDPGAGTINLTSAGAGDIFVSKLNSSGDYVWSKNMGSSLDDFAHALAIDAAGSVYTTGYFADVADFDPGVSTYTLSSFFTGNPNVRDQVFVSKLDNSGNFVWAGALGGIKGYGIVASLTEVHTTGFFTSSVDFDPTPASFSLTTVGSDDIFMHKLTQTNVGITEFKAESDSKIFPNPAAGNFWVHGNTIAEAIIISDVLGKEVMRVKPTAAQVFVNMNNYENGIYFVRTLSGNTQTVSKLIIDK